MTVSVLVSAPEPTGRHTVTGRLYSSAANDQLKSDPVRFEKPGAATVAAVGQRWYNHLNVPVEVLDVTVSAATAPTGSALTADVKINGTSVFAAAGDRASLGASQTRGDATRPTKTGDAILVHPGQYLTAEYTAIGSGTAGSDTSVEVRLGRHGRQ